MSSQSVLLEWWFFHVLSVPLTNELTFVRLLQAILHHLCEKEGEDTETHLIPGQRLSMERHEAKPRAKKTAIKCDLNWCLIVFSRGASIRHQHVILFCWWLILTLVIHGKEGRHPGSAKTTRLSPGLLQWPVVDGHLSPGSPEEAIQTESPRECSKSLRVLSTSKHTSRRSFHFERCSMLVS